MKKTLEGKTMPTVNENLGFAPRETYLQAYAYAVADSGGILDCWIDYEPADPSTGYSGSAWLVHAMVKGVAVIDLLSASTIKDIESEARCSLSQE